MSEKEKQEIVSAFIADGKEVKTAMFGAGTYNTGVDSSPTIGEEKIVSPLLGTKPVTETVLPELLLPSFMVPDNQKRR